MVDSDISQNEWSNDFELLFTWNSVDSWRNRFIISGIWTDDGCKYLRNFVEGSLKKTYVDRKIYACDWLMTQ